MNPADPITVDRVDLERILDAIGRHEDTGGIILTNDEDRARDELKRAARTRVTITHSTAPARIEPAGPTPARHLRPVD